MTENATPPDIEPGLKWEIDRMRPEDAEGVARLFRSIYGEGYPVRTFMNPELLVEENRIGRTISSVARTSREDIVGHNAIFHSAPSDKVFESGAGLVHRHYRGGKGIFSGMVIHGQGIAEKEFKAGAIWGEPVCNHFFSQKSTHSMGWRTFAVEVDLMPAAAYTKEASAEGRVTTLMDFRELNPGPHRIFVPPVYEDQLEALYGDLSAPREKGLSQEKPGMGDESLIEAKVFSFAQVARMSVTRIGPDFETALSETEINVLDQGVEILQIWLQLTDPCVGWAVDRLRSTGYFFGGLLPRWFDGDGMLMQRTIHPPHWHTIQIAFDRGRMVVDMAKSDWASVSGEALP